MLWVASFELLAEAWEEVGRDVALGTCAAAAMGMAMAQQMLR